MDLPARYEEDVYAWALHQAEVLRRMKAVGTALPNDLDLDNVAEEIECLGNEQLFQVESNLEQALLHLIKMATQPDSDAYTHWAIETLSFLGTAIRRYRPSMRRALDLQALWTSLRRQLRRRAKLGGETAPPLPEVMPFTLDELLDEDADPRALAVRLADLLHAP
ncbi:MAG TPA: DUF29 domain-containing protein [Falsiroseomonas sp.]|jgi:hypothetical protein|nr:DUF29 domain-containing protein [Falsiroseomonas sp.]